MSYDMWFQCPCCSKVIEEHNMTYNYAPLLYDVFGEEGIRSLYGHKPHVVAAKLTDAINLLTDDGCGQNNGWDCTQGNLKQSLWDFREKIRRMKNIPKNAPIFLEGD